MRSFKEDFHFLLQMEERARGGDGLLEVLRHVVWRQDPLVRLLFMLWDRPRGDEIDNEALELTKTNVRPTRRHSLERGVQSTLQTKHRLPIPQCLLRDTRSVRMRHGRHFTASKVGHNLGDRSRKFVCEIAICFKALASCLQIESGRLQHQKTNVSGSLLGNGCSIFIVKGCLRMYGSTGVS